MPSWILNHSELAPSGEKLINVFQLADYPLKMDARLQFKVIILTKQVLQLVDSLGNSVAAEENILLAQDSPRGSLNTDINALQASWINIQRIQVNVGLDTYRPYLNDLILAKPVQPKFAENAEKSKKLMDKIFNDILIDMKMANRFILKKDMNSAEKILSCVIQDADLKQVSFLG